MLQPTIVIDGESLTLHDAERIILGAPVCLAPKVQEQLQPARQLVEEFAAREIPTYSINTGFGFLAHKSIDRHALLQLQSNLIQSHASGYGPPLSFAETRLAMVLRLNVLARGYTGVRYELCSSLLALIKAEIYPIIPEFGSVGASGDLIPLAHLALPLLGLGEVHYQGKRCSANEVLKLEGLKPITLAEKEGLALINGTQVMLAIGVTALLKATKLLNMADWITALSYEALAANITALDDKIHALRAHKGQIQAAKNMLQHLTGSYLFSMPMSKLRLQDAYSLRCAPQVHGPSREAIDYAKQVAEKELNAVTDNPLVFATDKQILSGGNFHGQPLALAFDFAAMALAEIGNISERRLELLMNPHMSGLPAFLTASEGINSGYMALQYLAGSLVNDNKINANPACTDSIPANVGIEDHVSMGMTSARKLRKIVHNCQVILTTEMLAAAQAIDIRKASPLGQGTQQLYDAIRSRVPMLENDRLLCEDIAKGMEIFENFPMELADD